MASVTCIIINIFLVIGKVVTGILSGSVSVIADGLNNLMDVAGSVITLIGFKMSSKKADKEHPFGHGRYEYITGLAVAVLVLLVGIELGKASIIKIIHPAPVDYSMPTIIILIISILLKFWMMLFLKDLGKKINSTALIAVSADSKSDVLATSAVLISALISRTTKINLDGIAGLGVSIFIIYSGIVLIKETISPLLGESPSEELIKDITKKIESYDSVLGIHDILVHDYGPGKQFASAHVELSSSMDPIVSHGVIDKIEKDFHEKENIHLVIHYDPVEEDP